MAETETKAFRKEIDLGGGAGTQVFEADTAEQLNDILAEAQRNASIKIREQSARLKELEKKDLYAPPRPRQTIQPTPEFKPRTLTADDRFRIAQGLQDPARATDALTEAVEAVLGAPVETVRQALRSGPQAARSMNAYIEAEQFMLAHPEFINSDANAAEIKKYLREKKLAWTQDNLEEALHELSSRGLLELTSEAPAVPNGNGSNGAAANGTGGANGDSGRAPGAASETPRFASTGATSIAARGSGTPRGETRAPKMPTADEINRMSAREHAQWLRNPAFMRHEEALIASGKLR
jgi:hypothetical protein